MPCNDFDELQRTSENGMWLCVDALIFRKMFIDQSNKSPQLSLF